MYQSVHQFHNLTATLPCLLPFPFDLLSKAVLAVKAGGFCHFGQDKQQKRESFCNSSLGINIKKILNFKERVENEKNRKPVALTYSTR